jgi:hypothetical protein
VAAFDGRIWALDSGNERSNGQMLIGNMADLDQIRLDPLELCSGLPSPYIQEPGLLESDDEPVALSCADLTLQEEQSLMVNQAAAAIAARYCHEFTVRRELREFATYFNLEPLTATSRPISEKNISRLSWRKDGL